MVRYREALVLDAAFNPLAVVPWQRAVTLFVGRKARVLESQGTVTGRGWEVQIPSVLVLLGYIRRFVTGGVAFSRGNVYLRDKWTCQYCAQRFGSTKGLTLDHVVPRSRGGPSSWTNIVTACIPCNARKADRTPKEARMKLLAEPVQPRWLPTKTPGAKGNVPEDWKSYLSWVV